MIRFTVFPWSGDNQLFVRGCSENLVVGAGEGKFGLYIDNSLYQGRYGRLMGCIKNIFCQKLIFKQSKNHPPTTNVDLTILKFKPCNLETEYLYSQIPLSSRWDFESQRTSGLLATACYRIYTPTKVTLSWKWSHRYQLETGKLINLVLSKLKL